MSGCTTVRACGADIGWLLGWLLRSGAGDDVGHQHIAANCEPPAACFRACRPASLRPHPRVTMRRRGAKSHLRFRPKKTLTPDRFRLDQDRDSRQRLGSATRGPGAISKSNTRTLSREKAAMRASLFALVSTAFLA